MTVKELKELLRDVPDEAEVHAYEGEGIGIIVRFAGDELMFIETEPA